MPIDWPCFGDGAVQSYAAQKVVRKSHARARVHLKLLRRAFCSR